MCSTILALLHSAKCRSFEAQGVEDYLAVKANNSF